MTTIVKIMPHRDRAACPGCSRLFDLSYRGTIPGHLTAGPLGRIRCRGSYIRVRVEMRRPA